MSKASGIALREERHQAPLPSVKQVECRHDHYPLPPSFSDSVNSSNPSPLHSASLLITAVSPLPLASLITAVPPPPPPLNSVSVNSSIPPPPHPASLIRAVVPPPPPPLTFSKCNNNSSSCREGITTPVTIVKGRNYLKWGRQLYG